MLDDPVAMLALGCTLVSIIACVLAGSVVAPNASRWPGADMLVGFGLLTSTLTIVAVATRGPLSWLMAGLVMLALVGLWRWRPLPGGCSTWLALALLSPVLIKAAGHAPASWDDFWNWLPSAAYEYHQNSLPWPDRPPSLSIFPGYPQGIPLMVAAASLVGGRFFETAGPLVNVMLLAGSSALFAEALAAALVRNGRLPVRRMPLALVAGAVCLTTLLNPGLDGNVVLSSYADCGTMVAVGALGLLGVEMLARLPAAAPAEVAGLAWRFGLLGAMLVNLKQANPVLLALVTAGLTLIALRDPALRTARAASQLPRMLGPGIAVFAVWRWYVTQNLTHAEPTFRPLADWSFAALPSTFTSIGIYISEAPLFHALMWLVTAAGIVCFLQLPRKASAARWLAVVCATVWLGYNAFLIIIYLGVLTRSEAYGAADYWRYTPHVALLGLYAPVMALVLARWPNWLARWRAVPALALVALALATLPLRSDFNNPLGTAWQRFVRGAVAEMRPALPPGAKVVIVSFSFPDSQPFGVAVRYYLWQLERPEQPIATTIKWDDQDLEAVTAAAARGEADYLIIHDADGSMDAATDRLALPRLHHELALFAWRDGAWQRLRSWPLPPALLHRD